MIEFWEKQTEVNYDILQTKELIETTLKTPFKSMKPLMEHLTLKKGKYLRAGITILVAKLGLPNTDTINMAAALELLHLSTLIHDDIIDDAEYRRKEKSIQSKFGKDVAVYTGDFVLIKAYQLIADSKFCAFGDLAKAIEKICIGEIMQNENRYNECLSLREYLRIISGKTATLFALCAYVGAKAGGLNEKDILTITKATKYMGMAFQILDDCADYELDFENLNKEPYNDICKGIYTLPLIFYRKNDPNNRKELFKKNSLTIDECKIIAESVKSSSALKLSKLVAKNYLKKSLKLLNNLEENKHLENLKSLYILLCSGV